MTCIEMHCHFAMSLDLLSLYLAVRLISGPNAALIVPNTVHTDYCAAPPTLLMKI